MTNEPSTIRLTEFIQPFLFQHRSLLEDLPEADRLLLDQRALPEQRQRGEWLFRQGGYPKCVYWLVTGKAKIFQGIEDGERRTLYLYADGDLIAHRQLIADQPHPVSAMLMEDSVIRLIPAETFRGLIQTSPFFARNMLTGLAREFTVWINLMNAFKRYSVRQRIILVLLMLEAQDRESSAPSGSVSLSRTEIAEFVGAKLETVVRMLQALRAEGALELDGRSIFIRQPMQLMGELE